LLYLGKVEASERVEEVSSKTRAASVPPTYQRAKLLAGWLAGCCPFGTEESNDWGGENAQLFILF